MPRHSKGPRLYLRSARGDRGSGQVWVIRDGAREISTGCGPGQLQGPGGAEAQLAEYITSKYRPPAEITSAHSSGDPTSVLIADVVAYYIKGRAPHVADPVSTGIRLANITVWWAGRTLADIVRSTCQDYVAYRCSQPIAQARKAESKRFVTPQGARRELEDLSAAIGYWHEEYPLTRRPKVWMPEKKESPRDALTRHQAARLLWAARGNRWNDKSQKWEKVGGRARLSRAHIARFALIGFYTGTRPGVIPKLLRVESATQAYVDLEKGWIYRRGREEGEIATKRRPLVRMPLRLTAHMRRWQRVDERNHALHVADAEARGDEPRPMPATVLHHAWKPITGKIRKGFATVVRDAGLNPEITPHWMRHTCATWLMENMQDDGSVWEAASFAGMTVTTLETVYGHHRPNFQDKARKGLTGARK